MLEIGCGKGEFLTLICKLGDNHGIGYDPSFVPARHRSGQDVRFVREFFAEDTNEVAPDLLCCKMTLEHIEQTHRFLASVRSVANRKDSIIFFQVPDVDRILKEGAFWMLDAVSGVIPNSSLVKGMMGEFKHYVA